MAAFKVAMHEVQAALNGLPTEKVCQARLASAWEASRRVGRGQRPHKQAAL